MTQGELGNLIGYSQANIQKMEAGKVGFGLDTVEKIIERLAVPSAKADEMRTLAAFAAVGVPYSKAREGTPPYAERYLLAEARSVRVQSAHELRLPGPLQSEHFMLRQFQAAGAIDVAPLMRNRLERRAIFIRPTLVSYACVLAEEALHRAHRAFGRDVALDEIDYLLALNDPTVATGLSDHRTSIHLLPATAGVIHLPGDFTVLHLPRPEDSFIYVEHVVGADYCKAKGDVPRTEEKWLNLRVVALDREDTNDFLRKLRVQLASG
jgi:hypothetical protein